MKAIIIGGCGHIGTYLVPKLVRGGYHVLSISRGKRKPYHEDSAWREVEQVVLDREQEAQGAFEQKVAAMNGDVVIDLINFDLPTTQRMVSALEGTNLSHYLFCSSIWVHGIATVSPVTEDLPRAPLCDYGKQKAACEAYLHSLYRKEGFPETAVLPGHISGPDWNIINPAGNTDPAIFQTIARGEAIALPNFGLETLNHVHADDVAQVFMNAITHRKQALGESFHAVSAESITLVGYANAMYRWFGKTPKITLLPWDAWRQHTGDEALCETTYLHIARSGSYSMEKAKRLLAFEPRHTILETLEESVAGMVARKAIGQ